MPASVSHGAQVSGREPVRRSHTCRNGTAAGRAAPGSQQTALEVTRRDTLYNESCRTSCGASRAGRGRWPVAGRAEGRCGWRRSTRWACRNVAAGESYPGGLKEAGAAGDTCVPSGSTTRCWRPGRPGLVSYPNPKEMTGSPGARAHDGGVAPSHPLARSGSDLADWRTGTSWPFDDVLRVGVSQRF